MSRRPSGRRGSRRFVARGAWSPKAGKSFHPAGEREIRALESRLPVPPRRDVHGGQTCIDQRIHYLFQFGGRIYKPRIMMADLPLREPEDHRESRTDFGSDRGDHLGRQSRPVRYAPAVRVGAPVGLRPKELIEQEPLRPMQFDSVDPDALGVARGTGERRDHLIPPRGDRSASPQ